jgi:NADPH-dependent ferric siderophore reductase
MTSPKPPTPADIRKSDLQWLMNQPQGIHILGTLLAEADKQAWVPDPYAASFRAGMVEASRKLREELKNINLDLFQRLERELRGENHA